MCGGESVADSERAEKSITCYRRKGEWKAAYGARGRGLGEAKSFSCTLPLSRVLLVNLLRLALPTFFNYYHYDGGEQQKHACAIKRLEFFSLLLGVWERDLSLSLSPPRRFSKGRDDETLSSSGFSWTHAHRGWVRSCRGDFLCLKQIDTGVVIEEGNTLLACRVTKESKVVASRQSVRNIWNIIVGSCDGFNWTALSRNSW